MSEHIGESRLRRPAVTLDHSAKLGFPYPVQNIMVFVPIKERLRGLQQVVILQVPSQPPAQQAHQILWPPAQEDFMSDMLQRIQEDLFFQKRVISAIMKSFRCRFF